MQKFIRNSLFLGAVLMSQSAWAEISSNKAQQLIDASEVELTQQSMQKTLFDDIGVEVTSNLSDAKKAKAKKILEDEFAKADIVNAIKIRLQKELDDVDADYVLRFKQSDLGKKIITVENEAELEGSDIAAEHGKKLMADKATNAFAKEVNKLTGAGEVVAELLVPVFEMIVTTKLDQLGLDVENADIKKMFFNEMIKEATPLVDEEVSNALAYTYRNLSSAEKQEYLTFLRDKRAQNVIKITMEESLKGTVSVFRRWLTKVSTL